MQLTQDNTEAFMDRAIILNTLFIEALEKRDKQTILSLIEQEAPFSLGSLHTLSGIPANILFRLRSQKDTGNVFDKVFRCMWDFNQDYPELNNDIYLKTWFFHPTRVSFWKNAEVATIQAYEATYPERFKVLESKAEYLRDIYHNDITTEMFDYLKGNGVIQSAFDKIADLPEDRLTGFFVSFVSDLDHDKFLNFMTLLPEKIREEILDDSLYGNIMTHYVKSREMLDQRQTQNLMWLAQQIDYPFYQDSFLLDFILQHINYLQDMQSQEPDLVNEEIEDTIQFLTDFSKDYALAAPENITILKNMCIPEEILKTIELYVHFQHNITEKTVHKKSFKL